MASEDKNTSQLSKPMENIKTDDTLEVPPVKIGDKVVSDFQYLSTYDSQLLVFTLIYKRYTN